MDTVKARILIIDDEEGIRDLLFTELSRRGFEADAAAGGEEGIEKVRQNKYDIVLCDIQMPRVNGVQALIGIKQIAPETEVIMISGFATVENAIQSLKEGAYSFIQKPFNFDELFTVIDKALEKSELKTLLALYDSSKAIFSSLKLEELFPIMINLVKKVVRADEIALLLFDNQNQLYLAAASFSLVYYPYRNAFISLAEKLHASGKMKEASVIGGSPVPENPLFAGIFQNSELKSLVAYPIVLNNKNLGMLMVTRGKKNPEFSSADLRNLSIFVSQIAQAIVNTKLYEKLEIKIDELQSTYHQLEQTNRQLAFLEKMSAAGQVAAGIASQISSPVKDIVRRIDVVLGAAGLPPKVRDEAQKLKASAASCSKIIENLSRFSSLERPELADTDINAGIQEMLDMMDFEFQKKNIQVEKNLSASLPKIKADANQIKEMLHNLLLNALQSFPHGDDDTEIEKKVSVKTALTANEIQIEIADNGCGIAPEIAGKIFDPFFTTKDPERNVGIGLSIVSAILKHHGGKIHIKASSREGTAFVVSLPFPCS